MSKQAMTLALAALEDYLIQGPKQTKAIAALKEALQHDAEPVAFIWFNTYTLELSDHPKEHFIPLYTSAPMIPEQKEPVGGDRWGWMGEYNRGWNDCREAMLSASPQPTKGE